MDFLDFCAKYDSISIPKLQREYVQGSNEKGRKFIADIFDTITDTEDKDLPLDLIFGSFTTKGRLFEPVDGQQRLTTLFLLYLYIGKREKKNIKDQLVKFKYATRDSSTEFCDFLVGLFEDKNINFIDDIPSQLIKNHRNYYEKYNNDYTVQSMIKMLDIIHVKYEEKRKPCFDKLSRLKFEKCDLKEYKLNDELYVIMNDRGKSLSSVENLKSAFIGWMRNNKRKCFRDFFSEDVQHKGQIIPRHLLFSMKMDNTWSENLWKLAGYDTAKADTAMYKIFCRYFWNMAVSVNKKQLGDEIKEFFFSENENDFDFDYFQKVLDTTLKTVVELEAFFVELINYMDNLTNPENYADIFGFIKESLQGVPSDKVTFERFFAIDESYKNEKDSFSFGLNERFINFGLQLCLQNGKTINDSWKRFIWNLTYAGYVNSAKETTISHMNGIRKYGKHTDDIYEYLSTCSIENKEIDTINYEIRKAQYIRKGLKNSDCATIFNSFPYLEKHPFFQGDIDWFVLDDPEKDSVESYSIREANAKTLFDNEGLNPGNQHLVVRYIMSQMKIEFDSESNKKEQAIYISEDEKERAGLLKTQMHKKVWDEVIREILGYSNSDKNIISKMEEACNKMSPSYGNSNVKWEYWHKLICQKPELYDWICSIKSSFTPRLNFTETSLAIVMGGNASNGRIILNKSFLEIVYYVLEELKTKGYEFKEYYTFEIDGIHITMFQYDHFAIRIQKKNNKPIEQPYYLEIYSVDCIPVFCISKNNKKVKLDNIEFRTVDDKPKADKWIEAVDKNIN